MHSLKKRILSFLFATVLLLGSVWQSLLPITAATAVTPSISIGGSFMIALNADGDLFAWGDNASGALGNGTLQSTANPVSIEADIKFTQISAGFDHALALSDSGYVYAWGSNEYGQLGSNISDPITQPTPVSALSETVCVAVSAGKHFSLALSETGQIYAWGNNASFQLGESTVSTGTQRSTPHRLPLPDDTFVVSINAGYSTASATTNTGSILLWGENSFFQLGTDTEAKRLPSTLPTATLPSAPSTIALGEEYTSVLLKNGSVLSIGCNRYGQFGNEGSSNTGTSIFKQAHADTPLFSSICAGEYHTVALTENGTIYTAGRLIGSNTEDVQTTFTRMEQPAGTAVCSIFAGYSNGAALTQTGTVLTWGENGSGQLGDGTKANTATPVTVKNTDGTPFVIGTPTSMQSVTIHVTTPVPSPTYSVTIPSSIDLGVLRQTDTNDDSRIKTHEFAVSVNSVSHLPEGQYIVVSVSAEDGCFVLSDPSGNTLPYELHLTEASQTALTDGARLAEFTSGGTASAWIRVDQSRITHSGNYSGILNFNISMETEEAMQ